MAYVARANQNGPNTIRIGPGAIISAYRKTNGGNLFDRGARKRERNLRNDGNREERKLWMLEGDPKLLVVRVIDNSGIGPIQSTSQLSNDVFGNRVNPANMVRYIEIAQ